MSNCIRCSSSLSHHPLHLSQLILALVGNPSFFSSSSSPIWITDYMNGNKGVMSSLDSTCSFLSITSAHSSTSVQEI